MLLNQIEAFVNVVKYKSFSKAAKALFLSQPTISSHIKSLEEELGVSLIVRSTKEIYLSDAGQMFYEHALELLRIRDLAYLQVSDFANSVKGNLTIAASSAPAQNLLPRILSDFMKLHPSIVLKVLPMNSTDVITAVENQEIELGLSGMSMPSSKCEFTPIAKDKIIIIYPSTPEFSDLDVSDEKAFIKSIPFVWRENGSGTRGIVENYLESLGLSVSDLNIVAEFPTTETTKQAVYHGIGAAFISSQSAEDYIKLGYIRAFLPDTELLDQDLCLVCHTKSPLSPISNLFADYLRNNAGFLV